MMENNMTVVAVSGYFDPLHIGHLEYLEMAKQLGDKLIVIVNNDKQALLKKGTSVVAKRVKRSAEKSVVTIIVLYF